MRCSAPVATSGAGLRHPCIFSYWGDNERKSEPENFARLEKSTRHDRQTPLQVNGKLLSDYRNQNEIGRLIPPVLNLLLSQSFSIPRHSMQITNVKCISHCTSQYWAGSRQDRNIRAGIYGVGCATFTQRILAVRSAVEDYLLPLLIGRDPSRIEEIWQLCYALLLAQQPRAQQRTSGVDQVLWDIKGKAGMPPTIRWWQGARGLRPIAMPTVAATGSARQCAALKEAGYQYIRQIGGYGALANRLHLDRTTTSRSRWHRALSVDPKAHSPATITTPTSRLERAQMFEFVRSKIARHPSAP